LAFGNCSDLVDTSLMQRFKVPVSGFLCIDAMRPRAAKTLLSIALGALLAGCDADSSADLVAQVERTEFGLQTLVPSATDVTLSVGQAASLTSNGLFRDGTLRKLDGTVWTSLDPSVAVVDDNGAITAVGEGSTAIELTFDNLSEQAIVTVTEATLQALEAIPVSVEMDECSVSVLSVHSVFSDGTEHSVPVDTTVVSGDESIVTVQRLQVIDSESETQDNAASEAVQYQLVSHNAGSTEITVSSGDFTSVIPVVVLDTLTEIDIGGSQLLLEPGDTLTLTATGFFSDDSSAEISAEGRWSLIAEDGTDLGVELSILDTFGHEERPDTDENETDRDETDRDETDQNEPDDSEEDLIEEETESDEPFAVLSGNGNGSSSVRTNQPGVAELRFECGGLVQTAQVIIESPPVFETISIDATEADGLVAGDSAIVVAAAIFTDGEIGEFEENIQWSLGGDNAELDVVPGNVNAIEILVNDDVVLETEIELTASVGDVVETITLTVNEGVSDSLQSLHLNYIDEDGEPVEIASNRVHQIDVGDVVQFQLVGEYLSGRMEPLEDVFWGNVTPSVATVDLDGVVTAVSAGSAFISVAVAGEQINLPLLVNESTVVTVEDTETSEETDVPDTTEDPDAAPDAGDSATE